MRRKSQEIDQALHILAEGLRALKGDEGYWKGELSNSALSTATAVSAMAVCHQQATSLPWPVPENQFDNDSPRRWIELIEHGCEYLLQRQNSDGGFGDTDRSHSNIATTLLVIAAWRLAGKQESLIDPIQKAEAYVERLGSWDGLRRRYGRDKTFVVPILSNCALAQMNPWSEVNPLPFEAAALPQAWYRFVRLPVVSYAIPALVAIGQARFIHAPPKNPLVRWLRQLTLQRTRKVLRQMQPDSGGFLEATPLTSFVLMNLASIGLVYSDVARNCRRFILDSVQPDGSWPIDTNLATWVTSLAIHGLLPPSQLTSSNTEAEVAKISENAECIVEQETIDWLLSCQHRVRHPFTGAEPGGWGWTNLSGAVPDADDTPAALLALHAYWLPQSSRHIPCAVAQATAHGMCLLLSAVGLGLHWLLKLQNRDGGWPTFCRGWGTLPFDRSGADLTAHAIRALAKWMHPQSNRLGFKLEEHRLKNQAIRRAIERGLHYLVKQQKDNGAWLPLWFGNQDHENEENPVYGTGRVLLAIGEIFRDYGSSDLLRSIELDAAIRGIDLLLERQNLDGGWGGGPSITYPPREHSNKRQNVLSPIVSTIEETSVALEGLEACRSLVEKRSEKLPNQDIERSDRFHEAIDRGLSWLIDRIQHEDFVRSQPIGFYFAKLWYYERLYPYVFAAAALNRIRQREIIFPPLEPATSLSNPT